MSQSPRITIHMVSSLDGKIAKPDNSVNWFETADDYPNGVSGQDTEAFLKTIDCYVLGARTYELALALSKDYGWAYGDKPTIVLSHRKYEDSRPGLRFFVGELKQLVDQVLRPAYKNIWVVGGAQLAADFIRQNLADEIRISILPIILGEGLSFFEQVKNEKLLRLVNTTAYKNGMVELHYALKKG